MGAAQSTTSAAEQQPVAAAGGAAPAPAVVTTAPSAATAQRLEQRKPVGEVSKKEEGGRGERFDGESVVGRRRWTNDKDSTQPLDLLPPPPRPLNPPDHQKQASPAPAKLYRFVPDPSGRGGSWDLVDGAAFPQFFDADEDSSASAASGPRWFLEVGDLSAPVSDEYSADAAERRVTMAVESSGDEDGDGEDDRGIRGSGGQNASAPSVFALRFPDARTFRAFLDRYDECVFQNTYGRPGGAEGRAAAFGEDSVLNLGLEGETAASAAAWAAGDDEMPQAGASDDEGDGEDGDGDFDKTPPTAARVGGVPDGIRGLRLGAGERSYLVREGGRIEALRNVAGGVRPMEGGPVSFVLTPPAGGGGGGGSRSSRLRSSAAAAAAAGAADTDLDLTPGKMLLMRHETRLAALSASRPDRLLDADIETGRVVSEWSFQKDGVEVPMDDLANESRGAQLDARSTFLGLAANRLVRWDMRTREGAVSSSPSPSAASASSPVVEWAGGKDYARGTRFSCLATAGDGSCVVGSADGQVRLFSDRSLTRAATSLPGLGAAVTSVDVTFDGRWALATTAKYLMVLKTSWLDSDGKVASAFRQRMGRSAPAPRSLCSGASRRAATHSGGSSRRTARPAGGDASAAANRGRRRVPEPPRPHAHAARHADVPRG